MLYFEKTKWLLSFFTLSILTILSVLLFSCKKQNDSEDNKEDKLHYKYKDNEMGYFRGNITPLIGGDMRNLFGSVKLYAEKTNIDNTPQEYRIIFNAITYGSYFNKYSEQKIKMEINLTNIQEKNSYSIFLNDIKYLKRSDIDWIYTTAQYNDINGKDQVTFTYIPQNKRINIVITKVYHDPYYPIPVVEGYVEGELSNSQNIDDIVKLNFEFKSRYYESFERQ